MMLLLLPMLLWCGAFARTVNEDLSKYWEKDFKEIGHLYGKTSDIDLYGVSLPPPMIYNAVTTKRNDVVLEHTANYEAGDLEQSSTEYKKKNYKPWIKPEQSVNYYRYSESDTIKQDEQTNKRTNQIPQRGSQNIDLSPKINLNGFKPYLNGNGENHSSLQNFHSTERNVAGELVSQDIRNKARNKVRQYTGSTFNPRAKCPPRICGNKYKTAKRIYSRPVKKIKRIVVY